MSYKTYTISISRKILTFLKALFWQINAGFPKATSDEIRDRLNICMSCEYMEKTKSQCLMCGCNLSNKKIFMNKLAWADQECPVQKWKKIKR